MNICRGKCQNYLKLYISCYSLMTELTPLVQKLMGEEYISLKYACMIVTRVKSSFPLREFCVKCSINTPARKTVTPL